MLKKIILVFLVSAFLLSCKKADTTPTNTTTNKDTIQTSIAKYGAGVTDIDGNKYKTVIIGTQEWMGENLKVTKYNDGTLIPNVVDNVEWSKLTTAAWCNYNNNDSLGLIYGKLYNWYVVNTQKVCPVGWHVPSNNDWTKLIDYLGGDSVAGGKLKEVGDMHWKPQNFRASNYSLFKALPGGYTNTDFYSISKFGYWWSSTEIVNPQGTKGGNNYFFLLIASMYESVVIETDVSPGSGGLSIRCLKD